MSENRITKLVYRYKPQGVKCHRRPTKNDVTVLILATGTDQELKRDGGGSDDDDDD
jgi:hypothetical protein